MKFIRVERLRSRYGQKPILRDDYDDDYDDAARERERQQRNAHRRIGALPVTSVTP